MKGLWETLSHTVSEQSKQKVCSIMLRRTSIRIYVCCMMRSSHSFI